MTTAAWSGAWSNDLLAVVRNLQFPTVTGFSQQRPGKTYHELSSELSQAGGREFAPVQIETVLRDEAIADGLLPDFAKQSLVRHLRNIMSRGWQLDSDGRFAFSHAIGAWASRLPSEWEDFCTKVAERIVMASPPSGWLPTDPSDAIIAAAFEMAIPNFQEHNSNISTPQLFCPDCTAALAPPADDKSEQVCAHCGCYIRLA